MAAQIPQSPFSWDGRTAPWSGNSGDSQRCGWLHPDSISRFPMQFLLVRLHYGSCHFPSQEYPELLLSLSCCHHCQRTDQCPKKSYRVQRTYDSKVSKFYKNTMIHGSYGFFLWLKIFQVCSYYLFWKNMITLRNCDYVIWEAKIRYSTKYSIICEILWIWQIQKSSTCLFNMTKNAFQCMTARFY